MSLDRIKNVFKSLKPYEPYFYIFTMNNLEQ